VDRLGQARVVQYRRIFPTLKTLHAYDH
jgi:hypothetical protein